MNPVELLRELIRNRCVNDGTPESGGEVASIATLANLLGKPELEIEPIPRRRSALWRVPGSNPQAPRLMLMAHVDVVPASTHGWEVDPFAGDVVDGFVWGRGAVDMLNVAAAMVTVFAESTGARHGDLLLAAVADEENAGSLGAKVLVEEHWPQIGAEYVMTEVAYPAVPGVRGSLHPVSVAEKGPNWTRLRARGVPGHGSTPYLADNAIATMVEALSPVFGASGPVVVGPEWKSWVAGLGLEDALADPEAIDAALERLAADDPQLARYAHAATHLTISPNVIGGGLKVNVIPDEVLVDVDARALPGQDRNDVDLYLRKTMAAAGDRIEIEAVADHPATSSSTDNPLWSAIGHAFDRHTGEANLLPTLMPVATDGRFFRHRGSIVYGTGWFDDALPFGEFLTLFHGNNERVSVASVERTTSLLRTVVDRFDQLIAARQ